MDFNNLENNRNVRLLWEKMQERIKCLLQYQLIKRNISSMTASVFLSFTKRELSASPCNSSLLGIWINLDLDDCLLDVNETSLSLDILRLLKIFEKVSLTGAVDLGVYSDCDNDCQWVHFLNVIKFDIWYCEFHN